MLPTYSTILLTLLQGDQKLRFYLWLTSGAARRAAGGPRPR